MALTDKLSAIGDAIRSKNGATNLMTLDEMPAAIEDILTPSGLELPQEALTITGDCDYLFYKGHLNWLVQQYGDKITTNGITNAAYMFHKFGYTQVPFDLNFDNSTPVSCSTMFMNNLGLRSIGAINNLRPSSMYNMFYLCTCLKSLPKFNNLDTSACTNFSGMFIDCKSLRSIPEELLKKLGGTQVTLPGYSIFNSCFLRCHALDEIRGLNPITSSMTSNLFQPYGFEKCGRVKDIIFATQEDGTPYSVSWKNQTINLSQWVGYEEEASDITAYSSTTGITKDKQVIDDASYQALKNDPDWWTIDSNYSRYNRTSAVNTINSLPDTSAYLASAGGTNTIKFGSGGSGTDGGSISSLTEEEIAVAAAKGWTVTFA